VPRKRSFERTYEKFSFCDNNTIVTGTSEYSWAEAQSNRSTADDQFKGSREREPYEPVMVFSGVFEWSKIREIPDS
jgi:hypothetical protein